MPPDITTGSASGNAKWTVMVFMGAATIEGNVPLLEAAEADLAEMRFVGSGPVEKGFGRPGDELNIFVQVHQGGDIVPRRGRITENMAGLETHRAARNVMTLVERIRDFERRVLRAQDSLTASDSAALQRALLDAVVMLAPLTPHIAEELWAAAGQEGLVANAAWPVSET